METGNECKLEIHLEHNLDKNKLLSQINLLGNDSVIIFWYVGTKDLTVECAKYYQKLFRLISNPRSKIVLYDMMAWKSLFDTNYSICRYSTLLDNLEEITGSRMIPIRSNDFFNWLINILDNKTKNNQNSSIQINKFLESLFNDPKLFVASEKYPNTGIKICDLSEFAIFSDVSFYEKDTGKCYSCFQYIEMLYLVEKLINTGFKEIYFALPNDELKYYDVGGHSLSHDLHTYLLHRGVSTSNVKINICSFKFGNRTNHRPYNMGSELMDKLTIDLLS